MNFPRSTVADAANPSAMGGLAGMTLWVSQSLASEISDNEQPAA
jgi:hypothetical protein